MVFKKMCCQLGKTLVSRSNLGGLSEDELYIMIIILYGPVVDSVHCTQWLSFVL